MKVPRWLQPYLAERLTEVDETFWQQRRDGPLVLEIHYRGGRPQIVRLRDVLAAPVLLELSLTIAHAAASS